MIDVLTGIITLNGKTSVIGPGLTRGEFETSDLFGEVISTQMGLYTNYMIDAQTVGDKQFALTLLFNEYEIVDSVHMSLLGEHERPSWEQWGELDAQRRRKEHDTWLMQHLGAPPYRYCWGRVSPLYDPRSGSSLIVVTYRQESDGRISR